MPSPFVDMLMVYDCEIKDAVMFESSSIEILVDAENRSSILALPSQLKNV